MSDDLPEESMADVVRGVVRDVVRYELNDRTSLRKNGHTTKQYLSKVITPERVLLLAMTAFTASYALGGEVRDIKAGIADTRTTKAAVEKLREQQLDMQEQIESTARLLAEQQQALNVLTGRVGGVDERLKLSVTRGEFQSAIQQQIVPRLTRIERSMPGTSPR
jgi:hypothetical protein